MRVSAFCDAVMRATVEVASGVMLRVMTDCEKAVEVLTLSGTPLGHVCSPVVGSVVQAPAYEVQVLSAASGPTQACRSGFPSFW